MMFQLIRKTKFFRGGSVEFVFEEKIELEDTDLENLKNLNELVSRKNKEAKEKFPYTGGEAHWEWKKK